MLKIVSLFAGAGGLDLGFTQAGFQVVYANEYDKAIWETYRKNHPQTYLDTRSIKNIPSIDIPDCDGIIGGPPCQSWSEGGAKRGIEDERGQLFYEFIRILKDKQPKFFLAENVSGMLQPKHKIALENIKQTFECAGYHLFIKLLNAADYGVAQDRERLIFIGFRQDLNIQYHFPAPNLDKKTLKDVIADLAANAVPALEKTKPNPQALKLNHEYMTGDFSSLYLSRNRVRSWHEASFTIQASGRQAALHPSAPKMVKIGKDQFTFVTGASYRRLSVRECARIQGFPDNFEFIYKAIKCG